MASRLLNNRNLFVLALAGLALLAVVAISTRTNPAEANPATNFISISSGGSHTCGVTADNDLRCWGQNSFGQLGDGQACGGSCSVPTDVDPLAGSVGDVSLGNSFTCALTTVGGVKCWGRNNAGQLGDGTTTSRTTPVDVTGLTSGVAAIAAGEYHACAVATSGAVKCWGWNDESQLGAASSSMCTVFYVPSACSLIPVQVAGLTSGVSKVAGGDKHTCAVLDTGAAKCWGWNAWGQVGDGSFGNTRSTPVDVSTLSSGVIDIDAGGAPGAIHTCAVLSSGTAKCWGSNEFGQIGDGTIGDGDVGTGDNIRIVPTTVTGLTNVSDITTGQWHSCATTTAGDVKCWGHGGRIGDGTGTPRPSPTDVTGLAGAGISVNADEHTCALTVSGGAKCWGANSSGQLGNGTTGGQQLTPVDVIAFAKPTATPCPPEVCTPTPTNTPIPPTATPTPCPDPDCGLEFHIGAVQDGGADECDTSGRSTTCNVAAGALFTINAYLDSAGSYGPYEAVAVHLQYNGVSFTFSNNPNNPEVVWPDCVLDAFSSNSNFVNQACAIGIGAPLSTYDGNVVAFEFTCAADGDVSMVHSPYETLIIDGDGNARFEGGPDETLTIDCVDPAPYPADTDGDGCPDMNEAGPSPLAGGQRNFLNEWDYFNPTHDGENRIDDVLAVRDQYFIDQGDGGYTENTDRTLLGPNAWNTGAPNGLQRVDDILNSVKQYFHDCS